MDGTVIHEDFSVSPVPDDDEGFRKLLFRKTKRKNQSVDTELDLRITKRI